MKTAFNFRPLIRAALLLALPLFLLPACQTSAPPAGPPNLYAVAIHTGLSSNWVAGVRSIAPAGISLNFQASTNWLCQEARHGNPAAEMYWGNALVVQSHSPREAEAGLDYLRRAAGRGNVTAMINLGMYYQAGIRIRRNYGEAFKWFRLAADRGNAAGQIAAGYCYYLGRGVTPNPSLTVQYYRQAANQTNYDGMRLLGDCLIRGFGTKQDTASAMYFFTRAAVEGHNRRAMFELGLLYMPKTAYNFKDATRAFQWFADSAELGDPMGAEYLADCYRSGTGVLADQANFRSWRFKAAILGATKSQYQMGKAYQVGDGVPIDQENARQWYRKAAAKDHPLACYELARYYLAAATNRTARVTGYYYMLQAAKVGHDDALYQAARMALNGEAGPPDFQGGARLLALAGTNRWAPAEFYLFQLYDQGLAPFPGGPAFPHDQTAARTWLYQAVNDGSMPAMTELALRTLRGNGVPQNAETGEDLLRNAAAHGSARAQSELGAAIFRGEIHSNGLMDAAMWLQLAATATDSEAAQSARDTLAKVLPKLTPSQKNEVAQLVAEFQPVSVEEKDPLPEDWTRNPAYQREDDYLR